MCVCNGKYNREHKIENENGEKTKFIKFWNGKSVPL